MCCAQHTQRFCPGVDSVESGAGLGDIKIESVKSGILDI